MTEPLTDQPDAREALLARLSEAALDAVQPEIDRLRANLTKVFHQLKATERESEQRLGELLFWEFEYREAMDNYKGEAAHAKNLRGELEQARAARLEWARTADHPELARWAESLVDADLTPHPAFAWRGTTTGYEVAAQIATTDQLTDDARRRLLAELQKVLGETVCRVLDRSPAAPARACGAEPVHQNGCEDGE